MRMPYTAFARIIPFPNRLPRTVRRLLMPANLLIILDGWGHREAAEHNAIHAARTPHWDRLWRTAPHALISGSGPDVGLPEGQMGNSEVGHMHLGAGRLVHQDLTRIQLAIQDGSFAANPALREAIALVQGGTLHVMGLLSPGGVHSHEDQIHALVALAEGAGARVRVHAFLDGRDTPPRSAAASLARFENRIASICGRYYAMDRDGRWERTRAAFDAITGGAQAPIFESAAAGLRECYAQGLGDEFAPPALICPEGAAPAIIRDGDVAVFMNFRADRARQLTRAFVDERFAGFERRKRPALKGFFTLTRYAEDIPARAAFEPRKLVNTFGEHLSALGRRQLRIAETEKYAHVTFFFSGGREAPFPGEDRILVPSPKVATYDQQPEMSARAVTDKLVAAIEAGVYDAIVCNFANADMVGHTGAFDAAVAAVEALDECLGRVADAVGASGGQCLITADHGNVERMRDAAAGQPHTAHTSSPVPLVYVGPERLRLVDGALSDVAPTLLALMGLPQPKEMTGRSLIAAPSLRRSA